MTAYSTLLLATVGAVDLTFFLTAVPRLARLFHAANQALPLALRILIGSTRFAPWMLLAIGVVAIAMHMAQIRIPATVKSRAMPAAAWFVITSTLVILALTVSQLQPNA